MRGLPWWSTGSKSTCQWRGHGFDTWSRMIPPALEQRSPRATTIEMHVLLGLCSTGEATALRSPHAPKLEKSQSTATNPAWPKCTNKSTWEKKKNYNEHFFKKTANNLQLP